MVKSEERVLNIEELLTNIHNSKEKMKKYKNKEITEDNEAVNNPKHMSKNLPIGMTVLVILFAALGTMVIMLKAEVADFGSLREQIAANDSKSKIAIIEGKIETSEKERETLKNELALIKNSIEALRRIKIERKSLAHR
ncbi:MAG: hypothetical protein NT178_06175 [Proteobacteria bacterium]|nr:hypothetical protein [Pseudomonadota bacterium]